MALPHAERQVRRSAAAPNRARPRRGSRTRQQILRASLRLFAQGGFAGTPIRRIARAAGVSDATLYHHFGSKRGLLTALYEERGFLSALDQLERPIPNVSLKRRLLAAVADAVELMEREAEFLRLVSMEALAGDRLAVEQQRAAMARWMQGMGRLLQYYVDAGQAKPVDAVEVARRFVYLFWGAYLDRLVGGGSFGPPLAGKTASDSLRAYLLREAEELADSLSAVPSVG